MILQKQYNYENVQKMLKNNEGFQNELFNKYTQPQVDFSNFIDDYIYASQFKDSQLYNRLQTLLKRSFTLTNIKLDLENYFNRPDNLKQAKEMLKILADEFNNKEIKDLVSFMVENIDNINEMENYVNTIIENLPLEDIEKVNKIENEIKITMKELRNINQLTELRYIETELLKRNIKTSYLNIFICLSVFILIGSSGLALFIYLLTKNK